MVRNLGLLMEMLAIVYGTATFFGKKVKYDIKTVLFIISVILLSTLINEYQLPVYLSSLSYIIIFIYSLLEYDEGIKGTVLNFLLTSGMMIALQQIFYIVVFFLLPDNNEICNVLLIHVGCLGILWILMHYEIMNKCYKAILKNRKIYISLMFFVCICLLGDLIEAKNQNYLSGKDYLQLLYFIGLMFVVINEWQRSKVETEKKKAELEMNRLYYSAYEELVALIRDRQHDIKNHINTIYSIIYTTNSYEELVERQKQYCNFVLESSKETQILLAAGNPLISGFLYQKNQEIKSRGMQVDYKLEKISFPLAATEYEIIEMLGILVDNAIEELAEADHESKKIVIGYTWDEQWDIFYVSNTSRNYSTAEIARFFERNYSSKGNGRGIGLDKMRRKLQQLDGGIKAEMEPYGEAQYLKFSIMLPKQ